MKNNIILASLLITSAFASQCSEAYAQNKPPTHREQAQAQFDFWSGELTRAGGPCDESGPKYNPVICDEIETMVQRYYFYIKILDALPAVRSWWQRTFGAL